VLFFGRPLKVGLSALAFLFAHAGQTKRAQTKPQSLALLHSNNITNTNYSKDIMI